MKSDYSITIYAQDHVGLLLRIVQIILRKNLNIERLVLNESAVKGITWINFTIKTDIMTVKTLVKTFDKQVNVIQSFYSEHESVLIN